MAHHNTVFSQLLKLVPRHQFEILVKRHHVGRRFRKTSRWSQFVALATGQLAGRRSLRDIVSNLTAQCSSLYHLGARCVTRSTLARLNEQQPYAFYEALFGKLYGQCRSVAPRHGFRFKNKLYSLDASTIDLSLSIFPWAKFRKRDGALKLHAWLDHDGGIPGECQASCRQKLMHRCHPVSWSERRQYHFRHRFPVPGLAAPSFRVSGTRHLVCLITLP